MKRLFTNACILAWDSAADTFRTIHGGFLGVDGDTICVVSGADPGGAWDETIDMSGRLLMPGLVNAHCHAAMVLLRGVGSDLPLQRWLFEKIIPVEDRLTAEQIAAGNELAMMEMIASGTTSYTDMYMEPRTAIRSNEAIGMKMNVTRVLQSFDPGETAETCPRVAESLALYEECNGVQNGRVRIDFSLHAEYTINDSVASGYAKKCAPYAGRGAQMQIHLSETKKEQDECVARHGMTPAAWAEAMGLFDIPAVAAHCVWVTDEDIAIMKRHGVSPVHNPTSNMKLGSGFAPVPKMLAAGLNVGLGTDGAASNNNLDMFEEMHLAAVMHNGCQLDPVIMDPATVLRMATVNGARLQGRSDTGKLEPGMKADIIAVDFRNRAHLYPAFEPMSMLVYAAQSSDVCMTMVDGRILYRDGRFLTLDPERVLANARRAVAELYGGEQTGEI